MLQTIKKRWSDLCVVAASGPSLTPEIAQACRIIPTVAVNDAYRLFPWADVLYACDAVWWGHHKDCDGFRGEKWSSHESLGYNNKLKVAESYGLNLIKGAMGAGFSLDPSLIHYGSNSGFQGVNLAIHLLAGRGRVILVGFDMRTNGKLHFFGEHAWRNRRYKDFACWILEFERAARRLPDGIEIINCTPQSALTCFPMMDLADALPVAA